MKRNFSLKKKLVIGTANFGQTYGLIKRVVEVKACPATTLGLAAVVPKDPSFWTKYFWPGVNEDLVAVLPTTFTVPEAPLLIAAEANPMKFPAVTFVPAGWCTLPSRLSLVAESL